MQAPNTKNQYLAAAVVLLLLINYGITTGWVSPTIDLLTSSESPLPTGKITMDEASWIASVIPIGALMSNLLYGLLMNWFGRKWPAIALAVPTTISGLLVVFAKNVYYLYAASIMQGFVAGGVLMTVPVYLVEIANDNVRGTLSSFVPIGYASGILLAFTLGNYCDFFVTPVYAIVSSIVFAVIFSMFPETPIFLLKQDKITDAEKSLRFYRNISVNDKSLIHSEIQKLKGTAGAIKLKKMDIEHSNSKWSDLTTKPGSRAMILAIVLALLNQLTGISAMLAYTATIFRASGSAMSPNASAMIVGVIKLLGTFFVILSIDRTGRRFLYVASTVGAAFFQIILGVYMMLNFHGYPVETFNWIPIVSFSSTLFLSALAVQALPISVIAEIMPENLKEIGITMAVALMTLSCFVVVKFMPSMADSIGFHGCMFSFAAIGLLDGVFLLRFLPETKNRSYKEIMEALQ